MKGYSQRLILPINDRNSTLQVCFGSLEKLTARQIIAGYNFRIAYLSYYHFYLIVLLHAQHHNIWNDNVI